MNKDNAAQYLPLVQALADGKTLQVKTYLDIWADVRENTSLTFTQPPSEYRIKPEPQKLYGLYNNRGLLSFTSNKIEALDRLCRYKAGGLHGPYTLVTFVEENNNGNC